MTDKWVNYNIPGIIILVSVIIPIYNAEKFLNKCIISVINQTYQDIEIILINDGSTDKSGDICNHYLRHDKRIKYFYKNNGGVSSARNFGISQAQGTYIIFIDSDDWIENNYVKNLVNQIDKQDSYFIISGYTIDVLDKNNKVVKTVKYKPVADLIEKKEDYIRTLAELINKRYILSPWGKIYRLDIIKDNQISFDISKSIGEDLVFNLDYLNKVKKIKLCKDCKYHYILSNAESLTKKFGEERIENTYHLFLKGIDFLKTNNLEEVSWVFYKYYFKSQMNFIESQIHNRCKKEKLEKYITKILEQDIIKNNYHYKNCKDIETVFYYVIFTLQSHSLFKLGSYFRIFIKKYIRKF